MMHEIGRQSLSQFIEIRSNRGKDPILVIIINALSNEIGFIGFLKDLKSLRPEISLHHFYCLLSASISSYFKNKIPTPEEVLDTIRNPDPSFLQCFISRNHSFSSSRRFVLAQIIFSYFFQSQAIRHIDLGAGLGLLSCQLNNKEEYEDVIANITCSHLDLTFKPLNLQISVAVDKLPLPSIKWVSACHPNTHYYQTELRRTLRVLTRVEEERAKHFSFFPCDITNHRDLCCVFEKIRPNAVTCNLVMYQLTEAQRKAVIKATLAAMDLDGIILSLDPLSPSHPAGRLTLFSASYPEGVEILEISDNHCQGNISLKEEALSIICAGKSLRKMH